MKKEIKGYEPDQQLLYDTIGTAIETWCKNTNNNTAKGLAKVHSVLTLLAGAVALFHASRYLNETRKVKTNDQSQQSESNQASETTSST